MEMQSKTGQSSVPLAKMALPLSFSSPDSVSMPNVSGTTPTQSMKNAIGFTRNMCNDEECEVNAKAEQNGVIAM